MDSRPKKIAKEVGKTLLWKLGEVTIAVIGVLLVYYVAKTKLIESIDNISKKPQPIYKVDLNNYRWETNTKSDLKKLAQEIVQHDPYCGLGSKQLPYKSHE